MALHQNAFPATQSGALTVILPHGASWRNRSVGTQVLVGLLEIPAPPSKVVSDWERELVEQVGLEPGDVETLPIARTRMRWPDLKRCIEATTRWALAQGLTGALTDSAPTLMACRGARYHHDAVQYGGAAFCNVFLSDDQGIDLHFPGLQLRIPLRRGLVVVFDTGQPHAVIPRDRTVFDPADFPPQRDCSQVFLTWELALEHSPVAQALDVTFGPLIDTTDGLNAPLNEGQLWHQGAPAELCPYTGHWVAVQGRAAEPRNA